MSNLPKYFTMIRHGMSEENRVQRHVDGKRFQELATSLHNDYYDQHDAYARLTGEGIMQAQIAGAWLQENTPLAFDRFYVSPHARTRETAGHLSLNGTWIVDDRIRERDYGEESKWTVGFEQEPYSEASQRLKKAHPWYWCPAGGESLATGVRSRAELLYTSLNRRPDIDSVIAVSHGEFIRVMQFIIERLTPDKYLEYKKLHPMDNTTIVQYTRVDPENHQHVTTNYHWRRVVCPYKPEKSWNDGKWEFFQTRKHSDSELLTFAAQRPRMFLDERDILTERENT